MTSGTAQTTIQEIRSHRYRDLAAQLAGLPSPSARPTRRRRLCPWLRLKPPEPTQRLRCGSITKAGLRNRRFRSPQRTGGCKSRQCVRHTIVDQEDGWRMQVGVGGTLYSWAASRAFRREHRCRCGSSSGGRARRPGVCTGLSRRPPGLGVGPRRGQDADAPDRRGG